MKTRNDERAFRVAQIIFCLRTFSGRSGSFHYLQVFLPARSYNLMMMMIIIVLVVVLIIIFLIISILKRSICHHHLFQKCNITASFKGEWLQKTGVEVAAQPRDT